MLIPRSFFNGTRRDNTRQSDRRCLRLLTTCVTGDDTQVYLEDGRLLKVRQQVVVLRISHDDKDEIAAESPAIKVDVQCDYVSARHLVLAIFQ